MAKPDEYHSIYDEPTYSCRDDPIVYRPWILYLAGLTIWAFQYSFVVQPTLILQEGDHAVNEYSMGRAREYIFACATVHSADSIPLLTSKDGCIAVLQVLSHDFANAESELLLEASRRLQDGINMLLSTS